MEATDKKAPFKSVLTSRRDQVKGLHGDDQHMGIPSALQRLVTLTADSWTPRAAKEEAFNNDKFIARAVESVMQRAALTDESALLQEEVVAHKATRKKRKRERMTEHARRVRCFRTPNPVAFTDKTVYVSADDLERIARSDKTVASADALMMKIASHMVQLGARLAAEHPIEAAGGLFIVADLAVISLPIKNVVVLAGGTVMDAAFFSSGGRQGRNISFLASTTLKRSIYVTPRDAASQRRVCRAMRSVASHRRRPFWGRVASVGD